MVVFALIFKRMLVSIGPCLPPSKCIAAFLALITEKFRNYTGPMGRLTKKRKAAGAALLPSEKPSHDETTISDNIPPSLTMMM